MDNTNSPGRAEARGSNSGDRRSERDSQLLLDRDPVVNRKLVRVWDGVQVYEVTELRVSCYEVETAFELWRFDRLYLAFDKQANLAEERSHRAS